MNRISIGLLLALSWATAWGQTTNCLIGVAGEIKCSQPQGVAPVTPSVTPAPMTNYSSPPISYPQVPSASSVQQQQQQLDLQRAQMRLLQEQQELDRQQSVSAKTLAEPDEVEQKAAYCSGVIKAGLEESKPMIDSILSDSRSTEETKAVSKSMLDDQEAKLARVNAYIYARLASLDAAPLLAAEGQGHADWKRTTQQTRGCYDQCRNNSRNAGAIGQCAAQCNNGSEAFQHTKMCNSLTFLPY